MMMDIERMTKDMFEQDVKATKIAIYNYLSEDLSRFGAVLPIRIEFGDELTTFEELILLQGRRSSYSKKVMREALSGFVNHPKATLNDRAWGIWLLIIEPLI